MANSDRCISCGKIIPDGIMVCPICVAKYADEKKQNSENRREQLDQDTKECDTCSTKVEPVKIGPKEAIKYFKEENETYEHMLGEKAKLMIEYRVNQLAIEVIEEKLRREGQ